MVAVVSAVASMASVVVSAGTAPSLGDLLLGDVPATTACQAVHH